MMYISMSSEIANPPVYPSTRANGKRGETIPCRSAIPNTTSAIPPSRKNFMITAQDKNPPATRKPVSDKSNNCPKRQISALLTTSILLKACGNRSFSDITGSPSLTFDGEAITSTSLTVGNKNIVQKYSPNRPSSAAQTTSELCAV